MNNPERKKMYSNDEPEKLFFACIALIVLVSITWLLFYAQLIPLHQDEAGFWFNYTNKSLSTRFAPFFVDPLLKMTGTPPVIQSPYHSLPIYLAKIPVSIWDNTGIAFRLPTILFAIASVGILFQLGRKLGFSARIAALASALLLLNPFFNQYGHELRSYPTLFFFSVCSTLCLLNLALGKPLYLYWTLLLASFVGCYAATFSGVIFIFVFMASVWALKITETLKDGTVSLPTISHISWKPLLIFSLISALFFSFLLFKVDRYYLWVMSQYFQGSSVNWIAFADFFSTFLGYKYLDDPASELYHYPLPIWLFSLTCFCIGLIRSFKEKNQTFILFVTFLTITVLVYIGRGSKIYTRTGVYLLPFILLFQAQGIFILTQKFFSKALNKIEFARLPNIMAVGILLLLASVFWVGKFKNLEGYSGNPYQNAKQFLIKNTKENDLIISGLPETISGFYMGKLIRQKIKNIYRNQKISNIYYLASGMEGENISLKPYAGSDPKKRTPVIPTNYFSTVAKFNNNGRRNSRILILKTKIQRQESLYFDSPHLMRMEFFNEFFSPCEESPEKEGFRLFCKKSRMACGGPPFNAPFASNEGSYQIGIFNHIDDRGRGIRSMAFLIPTQINTNQELFKKQDYLNNYFILNYLIDYPQILDQFKTNIPVLAPHLQKLSDNKNLILCMLHDRVQGNSILRGVIFIDINLGTPDSES